MVVDTHPHLDYGMSAPPLSYLSFFKYPMLNNVNKSELTNIQSSMASNYGRCQFCRRITKKEVFLSTITVGRLLALCYSRPNTYVHVYVISV